MSEIPRHLIIACFFLLPISVVVSQVFEGELSGLANAIDRGSSSYPTTVGVRYIPEVSMELTTTGEYLLDFEASANLTASQEVNTANSGGETSPYRLWVRYSTHRFESRLGLQKINFGPARLLRSLMWFDRLDPQDPLQLAEGVYALRLRYVFQNNANIWLWGLYGNSGTKGLEITPTAEESPEYGGRFQFPVGTGEVAVTTHNRVVDAPGERISERRIALDGVWDMGIGALFESALIKTEDNWRTFLTLGMDYTFGVGNGLTVLCEHLLFAVDDTPFGTATKRDMSGLMVLYPLALMDQLSYFSFYNWNDNLPYHFLSWQRNYDSWIWHLSVFWSKARNRPAKESQSITGFGRKGIQFMIIFNH